MEKWMQSIRNQALSVLPERVRRSLWIVQKQGLIRWPPVGRVESKSLWRVRPISRIFGYDRGFPVDRYYIERFLSQHTGDVQGHVLEIGDNTYTRKFGGERVTKSDVLHIVEGTPEATIIGDLSSAPHIASETFDCIICTQTLSAIYDASAAIKTLHRILKPGGVLLMTVPGICQVSRHDMERWGDYWRFTTLSVRKLCTEYFNPKDVVVQSYGNVLVAIALLHGLASEELTQQDLDYHDEDYQVNIDVRAVKEDA